MRVPQLISAQAWPNDGNNKAPKPGRSVSVEDGDNAYMNWLGGKTYMARTEVPAPENSW